MTAVRFYHLQRQTVEQALPKILEKVIERGLRAVVLTGTPERVRAFDDLLWTYDPASFLAHGSAASGDAELQPIWLTTQEENPNGATVLVLTDARDSHMIGRFQIVCDLFDGGDPVALTAARSRWRQCKVEGHGLTYWQQSETGGWECKA